MFEPGSRYEPIDDAYHELVDGEGSTRRVAYKRRRFLPPADAGETLAEHRVVAGDRLDLIAARYFGEPTAYWRVCDANLVQRPAELTEEVGRAIRIALLAP